MPAYLNPVLLAYPDLLVPLTFSATALKLTSTAATTVFQQVWIPSIAHKPGRSFWRHKKKYTGDCLHCATIWKIKKTGLNGRQFEKFIAKSLYLDAQPFISAQQEPFLYYITYLRSP